MNDAMTDWAGAMRRGDFEAAWAMADRILQARDPATRNDPSQPYHRRWLWDGEPLDGKRLLVRCYHGLGDTIQFARYLPLLARRARSVALEVQPRLIDLLSTLPATCELVPFDEAKPRPAQTDIEITELDHALRVPPSRLPPPYLWVTPGSCPPGTVGLCYRAGEWDPDRSMAPQLMASLCAMAPCITLVTEQTALPVLNPRGCPLDIGVTASMIAACDLVITVDTMVAHLAGALGRPTWLLLKAEPDWRWAPDQTRSPWYPTMRLYAQGSPGDWQGVIDRVAQDLSLRQSARRWRKLL